jgi:hypothetical protein
MKTLPALLAAVALLAPAAVWAADPPKKGAPSEQEMMALWVKAATPGPQHQQLQKLAGEWNLTVKSTMDPSQPATESHATATVTTMMEGRYVQEVVSGQMMGAPFSGYSLTGYDNVLGRYVSVWIDNLGTGMMTSEGTADAGGRTIQWSGTMSDPMTGKASKLRMSTTIVDDDHHTFEMFMVPPGGSKEMKTMTILYERKK